MCVPLQRLIHKKLPSINSPLWVLGSVFWGYYSNSSSRGCWLSIGSEQTGCWAVPGCCMTSNNCLSGTNSDWCFLGDGVAELRGLPARSSPSGVGSAWWEQSSFILVMSKFLNFISISFLWMPSGCQIFLSLSRQFMQCMLSILSCYHLPLLLLLQTPVTESTTPFMTIT